MALRIALDYDHTYNKAPGFWDDFCSLAEDWGHSVTIVTHRHSELDKIDCGVEEFLEIIYTDGLAKREFCLGLEREFDIWIDDRPIGIERNSDWKPDSKELAEWRRNGRV